MAKRTSLADRHSPKNAPVATSLLSPTALEGMVMVSPNDLQHNPYQPRSSFDEERLRELAASIAQSGLIEPIVVRPGKNGKYVIIAGERRWRAAQIAKLKQLPVIVNDCSDDDMELLALEENLHREDLNDVDRGRALKSIREKFGLTWEQLGQRVGLSRRRVIMLAGLPDLPEDIQEEIAQGRLTEKHSRALSKLKDGDQQRRFLAIIQREQLSGDRAIAAVNAFQRDPTSNIDHAVASVAKTKGVSEKSSRNTRSIIKAEAQLIAALDRVRVDGLSADERATLMKELITLIDVAQRIVGQLEKDTAT